MNKTQKVISAYDRIRISRITSLLTDGILRRFYSILPKFATKITAEEYIFTEPLYRIFYSILANDGYKQRLFDTIRIVESETAPTAN